jgi:hypothetical protein
VPSKEMSDMKRKLIIFLLLLMFYSVHGYAGDSKKDFDLHVTIPDQFSYIGAKGYPGSIDRYIEGYTKGFQEALETYEYKKEMKPDTVSGWGEFISAHYAGFKNAESQLRKFEKEMSEEEIRDLIREYI